LGIGIPAVIIFLIASVLIVIYLRIQHRKKYALLVKEKKEKEEQENAKRIIPEKRLLNESQDDFIINEGVTVDRSKKSFKSKQKQVFFEVDTIRTVMREKSLLLPSIPEHSVSASKIRNKLSSLADNVLFYDPRNDYFINDDITVRRTSAIKKENIVHIKPPLDKILAEKQISSETPLVSEIFTIKRFDSQLENPILNSNVNISENISDTKIEIPFVNEEVTKNEVTENKFTSEENLNSTITKELIRPSSTKSVKSTKSSSNNSLGSAKSVKSTKSILSKNSKKSSTSMDLKDEKLRPISEKPPLSENRSSDHVPNEESSLNKNTQNLKKVNNEHLRSTSAKSVKSIKSIISITSFKASELENDKTKRPASVISIKSSTHEPFDLESTINNQLERLNSAKSIESGKTAHTIPSKLEGLDKKFSNELIRPNTSKSILNSDTNDSKVDELINNSNKDISKSNLEKPVSIETEESNLNNEKIETNSIISVKFNLPESSVHIINETNSIYESDSFFEKSNVFDGFIRYNSAKSIKSLKSLKEY
jgi:hypothetical protein